jgi:hypothetical protein
MEVSRDRGRESGGGDGVERKYPGGTAGRGERGRPRRSIGGARRGRDGTARVLGCGADCIAICRELMDFFAKMPGRVRVHALLDTYPVDCSRASKAG